MKWNLPAGTQPGTTFRLRGKGVPILNGRGRGDQFVTVRVEVPTSLTKAQWAALEHFDDLMNGRDPESDDDSSVKNFFEDLSKKKKKK